MVMIINMVARTPVTELLRTHLARARKAMCSRMRSGGGKVVVKHRPVTRSMTRRKRRRRHHKK